MVVCKWSEIFCAPQKGCFDAILMTSLLNLRIFFTQATIAATIAVHLELNLEGRPLPSFRSTVPHSFRRSAIPCTVLLEQDSFLAISLYEQFSLRRVSMRFRRSSRAPGGRLEAWCTVQGLNRWFPTGPWRQGGADAGTSTWAAPPSCSDVLGK